MQPPNSHSAPHAINYCERLQSAFIQQACLTMQRRSSSHAVGIFPPLSPSLFVGPALLPLLSNLALAIAVVIGSCRRRLAVYRLQKASRAILGNILVHPSNCIPLFEPYISRMPGNRPWAELRKVTHASMSTILPVDRTHPVIMLSPLKFREEPV